MAASDIKTYFFCGVGGSGMMPLAACLAASGHRVRGSDRSLDQGKSAEKFIALDAAGIRLYPQDGSGVRDGADVLVVSSAVEDTIPDVRAAKEAGIPIITRGALLAQQFNAAQVRVAVAGTSGKSTVTGMTGTILTEAGRDPTVVNGGIIRNFMRGGTADYFANLRTGRSGVFAAEMDESDGSIAHYHPTVAVLNNIALDHKPMEELRGLFGDYLKRTQGALVLNFDDPEVRALARGFSEASVYSYGIESADARLRAADIGLRPDGADFVLVLREGGRYPVKLNVPGRHNILNALAALGAAIAAGVDPAAAASGLAAFKGIHRRMEVVGVSPSGITVIDDFGHNPDKIAASLRSLKDFPGRLIVFYQQHGFKPLERMRTEFGAAFAAHLGPEDLVLLPDVYYAGGTVERSVSAEDFAQDLRALGLNALWKPTRPELLAVIAEQARPGDRVVIMGARDDTLSEYARQILDALA
ncbi:MAG: UDP-N-acetylmuramate--alanine ligase [Alphaproteobacteria bacterium]|nr:UDP-N-acetylmuramate--alanine ligase [Alphaproteobacteria bacterium]